VTQCCSSAARYTIQVYSLKLRRSLPSAQYCSVNYSHSVRDHAVLTLCGRVAYAIHVYSSSLKLHSCRLTLRRSSTIGRFAHVTLHFCSMVYIHCVSKKTVTLRLMSEISVSRACTEIVLLLYQLCTEIVLPMYRSCIQAELTCTEHDLDCTEIYMYRNRPPFVPKVSCTDMDPTPSSYSDVQQSMNKWHRRVNTLEVSRLTSLFGNFGLWAARR